jgi:hypothetical protein
MSGYLCIMSEGKIISHIRLQPTFDAELLAKDLMQLPEDGFIAHFNQRDYRGVWKVLALRAIDGSPYRIYSDPSGHSTYLDTPYLKMCPYFKELIARFLPAVQSARLMLLAPGAEILRHTDLELGIENDQVRIHIPVQTNPDVQFFVNDEDVRMEVGECWYLNFNLPHEAKNNGSTDRIHLVLDCILDEKIRSFFPREQLLAAIENPATHVVKFIDPQ